MLSISLCRFVTRSDITDYVASEQLLTQFGGEDTWKYVFNREEMKREIVQIWNGTEEEEKHVSTELGVVVGVVE